MRGGEKGAFFFHTNLGFSFNKIATWCVLMAVILGNTTAAICAALIAQFLLQPQKIANTFGFFF